MQQPLSAKPAETAPNPATPPLVRIDSQELLRGQKMIEIGHGSERYTLRLTRDNKLILTK